jgi:hypothetical protein
MKHLFLLCINFTSGPEWYWGDYYGAKKPKLIAWQTPIKHAILISSNGEPVNRYYVKDGVLDSSLVNKSVLTKLKNKHPYSKDHVTWVPMFIGPQRR